MQIKSLLLTISFISFSLSYIAQTTIAKDLKTRIREKEERTLLFQQGKLKNESGTLKISSSPEQDCGSAIPVCQNIYNTAGSYSGSGNLNEIPANASCLGEQEKNSVWYTFTSNTSGNLAFQISPNSPSDDYDYALYDLTGKSCADIASGAVTPIRCNYSATSGNTGLSSSGINASENASGINQSTILPTTPGKTYVLIVSNYSSTQSGYSLDFSAGTASIFDNTPPTISSVSAPCGSSVLTINTSEIVQCASIDADGSAFTVTGTGSPYTVNAAQGVNCGANVSQITVTITPALSGAGPWTINSQTGTDGNTLLDACGNVMLPQTTTFTQSPAIANITGPADVCKGTPYALTANSANSYTWTGASVPVGQENNQTITVTSLSSGNQTFNVTIDYGSCGIATDNITVNVENSPIANFTALPSNTVCVGASVQFDNTSTHPSFNFNNYTWTFGDPSSGPNNTDNTNDLFGANPDASHIFNTPGIYNISLLAEPGNPFSSVTCTNFKNQTIYVIPNTPTLTISPSVTICPLQNTLLLVNGGLTYTWTPALGLSSTTTNTTNASPAISTNYTVESAGCASSASQTVDVVVAAIPPVVNITGASTVCPNVNNVSYSATNYIGTTYNWALPTGVTLTSSSSTTNSAISVNYTNTGGVFTVTATNTCGQTTATLQTSINNITVTATPNPIVLCSGNTFTAMATGANTYNWVSSTGVTTLNTNTISGTPTTSQSYTVTGKQGFCSDTAVVNVILVTGTGQITVANATTCPTGSVTLTASGAGSYTWSAGNNILSSNLNQASINVNPNTTSIYTVTGTSCSGTSSTTATVTIFNPLPVNATTSATNICAGSSANLTASGAAIYNWSPATGLNTTTGANVVASPTTLTTYTVTGNVGVCTNTAVVTISVTAKPVYTITATTKTICAGQSTILTATATAISSYTWNNGSSQNPLTVTPTANTTYTVSGNSFCPASGTILITVNALPIITVNSPTACINQAVTLTASGNATTYTWSTGANNTNTITVVPTSNTQTYSVNGILNGCVGTATTNVLLLNPIAAFTGMDNVSDLQIGSVITLSNTSTGYSSYEWTLCNAALSNTLTTITIPLDTAICCVKLTAKFNQCTDSVTKCVSVEYIEIPNVFSPNGDNANEYFKVKASGIKDLTCIIFDRWGLKMHEWSGTAGFWDGKTKSGAESNSGTYFYMINYTTAKGEIIKEKGHLTLVR